MNKIYLLSLTIFISSCVPTVRYVGQTLTPTTKVDVYVTRESIKKSFEFIGRGYVRGTSSVPNPEAIQRLSINIAKSKGADAILITDHYIITSRTFGVVGIDTTATNLSRVRHEPGQEFSIYFIKYTQ